MEVKGSLMNNVFAIDNLNFKLNYGSKYYTTPFRIKLRDFQLDRYPGSRAQVHMQLRLQYLMKEL